MRRKGLTFGQVDQIDARVPGTWTRRTVTCRIDWSGREDLNYRQHSGFQVGSGARPLPSGPSSFQ